MKEYLVTPKRLVNIKNIKELGGIQDSKNGLRIGATVTIDELLESAVVHKSFPALTEAARGVASPQIRNMGTVGIAAIPPMTRYLTPWEFKDENTSRNGFSIL